MTLAGVWSALITLTSLAPCSPGSLTVSAQLPLSAVGFPGEQGSEARPAADVSHYPDQQRQDQASQGQPSQFLCAHLPPRVVRVRQGPLVSWVRQARGQWVPM